jgi:predicted RNase H-like HicB family nuclease
MSKETKVLNYRVIIEKESYDDGTPVYTASVPTLGVFDYGDTIDAVLKSVKDGIEGMIEFLTEGRSSSSLIFPVRSLREICSF